MNIWLYIGLIMVAISLLTLVAWIIGAPIDENRGMAAFLIGIVGGMLILFNND